MKKLLPLVLFLLCSSAAVAQTTPKNGTASQAAVLKFSSDSLDFGVVTAGENVTREYVFTNNGQLPLVIKNVITTCACTESQFPKTPIAPGQSGTLTITFRTANVRGLQDKQIFVQSNNRDGEVVLRLKGVVEPNLKSTTCPTLVVSDTLPYPTAQPTPTTAQQAPAPARPQPVVVPVRSTRPAVKPRVVSAPRF